MQLGWGLWLFPSDYARIGWAASGVLVALALLTAYSGKLFTRLYLGEISLHIASEGGCSHWDSCLRGPHWQWCHACACTCLPAWSMPHEGAEHETAAAVGRALTQPTMQLRHVSVSSGSIPCLSCAPQLCPVLCSCLTSATRHMGSGAGCLCPSSSTRWMPPAV